MKQKTKVNQIKIVFHLGHPAHFHLFKNVISKLNNGGHKISILIKEKDVLKALLDSAKLPYVNILPEGKKTGKLGLVQDLIIRGKNIYRFCKKEKPDVLIGTSADISYIGRILGIQSINVNEDDANVVPMYAWMAYPLADIILSPESCNNGRWNNKTVKYPGYHELAYLHPQHFEPDEKVVAKYLGNKKNFILMRFASLNAHHDDNIRGISNEIALNLINKIEPFGKVLITSERELPEELEPYRLSVNPIDMHHFLGLASLVIGDSQTMSAEAAVLGTPYIRYNDFVGKIGYLNELENEYKLGFGIIPGEPESLISKAVELVSAKNTNKIFKKRKEKMLSEKVNTADFIYNYILQHIEN